MCVCVCVFGRGGKGWGLSNPKSKLTFIEDKKEKEKKKGRKVAREARDESHMLFFYCFGCKSHMLFLVECYMLRVL